MTTRDFIQQLKTVCSCKNWGWRIWKKLSNRRCEMHYREVWRTGRQRIWFW